MLCQGSRSAVLGGRRLRIGINMSENGKEDQGEREAREKQQQAEPCEIHSRREMRRDNGRVRSEKQRCDRESRNRDRDDDQDYASRGNAERMDSNDVPNQPARICGNRDSEERARHTPNSDITKPVSPKHEGQQCEGDYDEAVEDHRAHADGIDARIVSCRPSSENADQARESGEGHRNFCEG